MYFVIIYIYIYIFFFYYRNTHKCSIRIIINYKYKFCHAKMKTVQFSQKFKRQVNKNINFLLKVIVGEIGRGRVGKECRP